MAINSFEDFIKIGEATKIRELINTLNEATIAYDEGHPIITDEEWDEMYFELSELEKETNLVFPESPVRTIYFKNVSELNKVVHDHPMLSLDKTKDLKSISNFLSTTSRWIGMCKMDGLTCSLTYLNGVLSKAETRGNGIEGEDITHNARVIKNIPPTIYKSGKVVIDGEIICTYDNFEPFKTQYANPRNFAAGSIRLLNSEECFNRHLSFVAWDLIEGYKEIKTLSEKLTFLISLGFETVPWRVQTDNILKLKPIVDFLKNQAKEKSYPIDGLVFKYDNIQEYEAQGKTDHHFKGGLAYKFYDDTYASKLKYIDWTMGRTGVLTPVAVFEPVDIEGTIVERASLHNYSIMKETLGDCAYVGEPVKIIKANMIIPQIVEAGPKHDYSYIITHGGVLAHDELEYCPICNGPIIIKEENGIKRVYCDNPDCTGKSINYLDHFVGKKGLDIVGLSKATLQKLIDWGWVSTVSDLFKLKNYKDEWVKQPGFGEISVTKILEAIQMSCKCTTSQYICALGIPNIGKTASKALEEKFKTYKNFRKAIDEKSEELYKIDGIGDILLSNLLNFDYKEFDDIFDKYITEINQNQTLNNNLPLPLKNNIFVITGKLKLYKNRDSLKTFIEQYGGKVASSISSKTNYLINNDTNSTTAKNKTAKEKNIPIISEQEFQEMIKTKLETYKNF